MSGSHALPPRWTSQCSCIVIENNFDPGERLQAPGSLWFHQIFKILILFVLYFKNYKRQVVSWNCKHVQHVKIYLPCNFEVNPITHFDRLCKLEKRRDEIKKKIFSSETTGPIATKLLWNDPWMAPFQNCVRWSQLPTKLAAKLKIEKGGLKLKKNLLLWNYWANLNQTLLKWSLDGPFSKLCSSPSCIEDGRHD